MSNATLTSSLSPAERDALYASMDPATALQVLLERDRLEKLPESERAAYGTPQYWAQVHSICAMQSFVAKRITANRENAQHSTGPRTMEGLLRSSLNAQRHGLTGKSALLRTEDADLYTDHCERIRNAYAPVGDLELNLVSTIADTEWRLQRVPGSEAAIYAQGRMDYTHLFADYDKQLQPDLIDLHTSRRHDRELRNLHLQEGRLNRQLDKSKTELRQLQRERLQKEADDSEQRRRAELQNQGQAARAEAEVHTAAAGSSPSAPHEPAQPAAPQSSVTNGFVFTKPAPTAPKGHPTTAETQPTEVSAEQLQ